jgi:hypothetical protein
MPTHPDMPEGWQEHARRRSQEVLEADERARRQRAEDAPVGLDELARKRRERMAAEDARRAAQSVPPPPPGPDVA